MHFAAYSARVDRLSVLKTTFAEELALTAAAPAGSPLVVTAVAFRAGVRSEPRYVVSGAPAATGGTGFVATLSLMSKFEKGTLKYLQFYNLTCNDCGGWRSGRCLNGTSCTLPVANCTCADAAPSAAVAASPSPSPSPSPEPGAAADTVSRSNGSSTPSTGDGGSDGTGSGSGSNSTDPAASGGSGSSGTGAHRRRQLLQQQQNATAAAPGACNYTQFA